MPNLIHSLEASCLTQLFSKFKLVYNNKGIVNLFYVYDWFASTADKKFLR